MKKKTDIEYKLVGVSNYAKEGLVENELADLKKLIGCIITEYIEDEVGDKLYFLSDGEEWYGDYLVLEPNVS